MRSALVVPALLLAACKTEGSPVPANTTTIVLPEAEEGTIFAVVDLAEHIPPTDRYGRMGSLERLGGPTLEIEAAEPHVLQFRRGSFNGVIGPEPVFFRTNLRDGLDAVRLPQPQAVYAMNGTELAGIEPPALISELRVPCDGSRAATRPGVEMDPEPRCAGNDGAVVITCSTLATAPTIRELQTEGRTFSVTMTQEGCRLELSCVEDNDCAPGFPMRAILPPRASASGEDALMELVSVVDPTLSCARTDSEAPTFACPGATYTLIPR